jgi:rhodanese-related sulfurtransferase/DNA-binding transcriptional ArsR family regulator
MSHRVFKDRLYAEFATIGKALASPHRVELLDLLGQGERSVDELAGEIAQSLANTSAHLQVLRRARLVEADKRGLQVVYRLADPQVFKLWRTLRDLGTSRLAEIDRLVETYLTDRSNLTAVDVAELRRLMKDESVTLLDVRPELEYDQGHIPGARSIPVADLERRLAELPRDRAVVAYCRGPFCVYADEAAQLLRQRGFQVRRLEEGFPEWRSAGLPVEVSDRTNGAPLVNVRQNR